MKQITELDLPARLKDKLIGGGITTTGLLRVLTIDNFMHAFDITEATMLKIDHALVKVGEEPL